jgi:hypothetical protein
MKIFILRRHIRVSCAYKENIINRSPRGEDPRILRLSKDNSIFFNGRRKNGSSLRNMIKPFLFNADSKVAEF